MLVNLLRALSRASKRTQYHPITFDVTLRTEPYRGSERVIWGGLVIAGAYARVGGDYLNVRHRTYLLLSQRFNLAHQTRQLLSCHLIQRLSGSDRLY